MQTIHLLVLVGLLAAVLIWSSSSSKSLNERYDNDRVNVSTDGFCGPKHGDTVCPHGKCCSLDWAENHTDNQCGGDRSKADDYYCFDGPVNDATVNFGIDEGKYDGVIEPVLECSFYNPSHPDECMIGELVTYKSASHATPAPTHFQLRKPLPEKPW